MKNIAVGNKVAIDGGAHVGSWTVPMAQDFGGTEDQIIKMLTKMGYRMVWREGVDRAYQWFET
jgi:2-iminoacetate synthase ThiH